MKYIKNFETIQETSNVAAGDNTDPLIKPTSNGEIVDVINKHAWYAGKKAAEQRLNMIPRGILIERKQNLNSLLSGALYYLRNSINAVGEVGSDVTGAATKKSELLKSALNKLSNSGAGSVLKDGTTGLKKMLESLNVSDSDATLLERNNLNSLIGIYLTEPTGFKYVLPYLNDPLEVQNNWSDEGKGAVAGLVNKGMAIVEEISQLVNITQPGVYIQKPKYYNFEQEGKSVTFNFPLFNTSRWHTQKTPYQDNYELLWLLTYQNKPYKTSFARTEPGKIYTVIIPGQVSMPYAYMSNLSIDFKGTTRTLPVTIGDATIEAPIPEAYVVNITFTSLLNDYGNTMVGSDFNASIDGTTGTVKIAGTSSITETQSFKHGRTSYGSLDALEAQEDTGF